MARGTRQQFQSTLPIRGATCLVGAALVVRRQFQSTLPIRGATASGADAEPFCSFQSTLPIRGATWVSPSSSWRTRDFNPRSPYGERLRFSVRDDGRMAISIHAPHTGSDVGLRVPYPSREISIHAPHTGSDDVVAVRGRPPAISIHAPHTGSDRSRNAGSGLSAYFNPRSPYGERRGSSGASSSASYFNPRSPYGERPLAAIVVALVRQFQSTLPIRGATVRYPVGEHPRCISIHAPHTGSDGAEVVPAHVEVRFQSTLPIRGATSVIDVQGLNERISIHAPHTGSDSCAMYITGLSNYFNPRSPYGERR